MYARFFVAALLVALVSLCYAENVRFSRCYVPRNQKPNCTVHEVRITPCPEAAENKPCRLKAGNSASLSFDFTPNFASQSPQCQVSKVETFLDKPFLDMDTNACHFMTCPLQAGVRQTYTYSINVSNAYPEGDHTLKWQLWNENNDNCCFKIATKLTYF